MDTRTHHAASEERADEPGRGRQATSPGQVPARGWKDILWRVWDSIGTDHVSLVSAGTTFFLLLALFPALTALVSIYGFVADPSSIRDHVEALRGIVPGEAVGIIEDQLARIAGGDEASHGIAFLLGILVALWSANAGIKSIFEALNVAYDEEEKRGFIQRTLVSFAFTVGAILMAIIFMTAIAVVPAVLATIGLGPILDWLVWVLRWPVILVVAALGLAVLYRYGPSRDRAKWRWVTLGSACAALAWLAASMLFSWYLANFANYNETYGSLGAVIGLMMWTWISVMVIVIGAELNAELEHQTAQDTTDGPEAPLGTRGAVMADRVGPAAG